MISASLEGKWLYSVRLEMPISAAIVSTPIFRWFGDEQLNTFVAYPPFVWLPAVLVTAALLGHVLVGRKLAG